MIMSAMTLPRASMARRCRFAVVVALLGGVVAVAGDDRAALMDLYTSTNGANWIHNDGWGTQARCQLERSLASAHARRLRAAERRVQLVECDMRWVEPRIAACAHVKQPDGPAAGIDWRAEWAHEPVSGYRSALMWLRGKCAECAGI